jgi:serine/threonine protein kinase/tetratricopeptide (TPR) repeat protein
MVPRVGQKIGPYEILGRLGSGGMGLVFSAWDSRLQRDVAIKLLREEYATPGMRQRFLQEARSASRLNHPNICTVFDIGEQEGDPYLVMELLKGETIRSLISRGSTSTEDLILVATEVADALIVAHGRGIIHRDIKPANIMLVEKAGGRFQTKVLDFGLAKVDRGDGAETRFDLTSAGTTVGTVAYMSPEQARGEALDARSDLFSLGTVLYEMATGELPFQGATSALVFVQLLSQQPEPVREFNPEIPKDLEKIILTLLEKKRSDRFQSAGDVVEALDRIGSKRSSKGFWGTKPAKSWGRTGNQNDPPTLPIKRPTRDSIIESRTMESRSIDPRSTPPTDPMAKAPSSDSETFLRPVKRVLASDSARPESKPDIKAINSEAKAGKPDAHPSAFLLFQAASVEAHRPSTTSSDANRIAANRQPARSSSGIMPSAGTPKPSSAADVIPLVVTPAKSVSTPIPASPKLASSQAVVASASNIAAAISSGSDSGIPADPVPGSPPSQVTGKRFSSAPEIRYEDMDAPTEQGRSRGGLWFTLFLLLALVGGGYWYWKSHKATPSSDTPTSLLVISLTNRTGDTTLGGVFSAGLLLDLQQSAHLSVRGQGNLAYGAKAAGITLNGEPSLADARKIAAAVGASQFAFGTLSADGGSYTVAVRVYDASTGSKLEDTSESATSREQIGDAIDRLASDMRLSLGESGDAISRDLVPLSREASSNPDALQAYAAGDALKGSGKLDDAMFSFEHAIGFDPHFTLAYIELADIYRQQHAEVAAAKAATLAQDNSTNNGRRTQALAQASYALNALGDYAQAITVLQQMSSFYPADIETHVQLAVAQRLAGKYGDSLATAQALLTTVPYSSRARGNAEFALIALDRIDDANQMEQQGQAAGQPHPSIAALLGLLSLPTAAAASAASSDDQLPTKIYQAGVLDAGGQFTAGLAVWREAADHAGAVSSLASAASYALSRAALDRALAGDCATAQGLLLEIITMPSGPAAEFSAGLANAMCGKVADAKSNLAGLQVAAKQFTTAKNSYIPVLTAAIQWKSGDATGAVNMLQGIGRDDSQWIVAYLKGMIHGGTNQPLVALSDLQPLMEHRGNVSLVNPTLYSLAQLQVARAYSASGDARNSSDHYKSFLSLWTNADPGSPLVAEAQAHTN